MHKGRGRGYNITNFQKLVKSKMKTPNRQFCPGSLGKNLSFPLP
jgi:hypothetical protein